MTPLSASDSYAARQRLIDVARRVTFVAAHAVCPACAQPHTVVSVYGDHTEAVREFLIGLATPNGVTEVHRQERTCGRFFVGLGPRALAATPQCTWWLALVCHREDIEALHEPQRAAVEALWSRLRWPGGATA